MEEKIENAGKIYAMVLMGLEAMICTYIALMMIVGGLQVQGFGPPQIVLKVLMSVLGLGLWGTFLVVAVELAKPNALTRLSAPAQWTDERE